MTPVSRHASQTARRPSRTSPPPGGRLLLVEVVGRLRPGWVADVDLHLCELNIRRDPDRQNSDKCVWMFAANLEQRRHLGGRENTSKRSLHARRCHRRHTKRVETRRRVDQNANHLVRGVTRRLRNDQLNTRLRSRQRLYRILIERPDTAGHHNPLRKRDVRRDLSVAELERVSDLRSYLTVRIK